MGARPEQRDGLPRTRGLNNVGGKITEFAAGRLIAIGRLGTDQTEQRTSDMIEHERPFIQRRR